MESWIGLHKLANVVFGITQKPPCIKSSKLPIKGFCPLKLTGCEKKNQDNLLEVFNNSLSKYLVFQEFCFAYIGCFGLFTKNKKESGTHPSNFIKHIWKQNCQH